MKRVINIFETTDEMSQFVAQQLVKQIADLSEGQFFSVALSGGSTPKSLFRYLALNYLKQIDWRKLLVFWGDERCVAPENDESNYRMARENLLDLVPVPKENIFRILGENDPAEEAIRYTETVKKHLPSIHGIPQFDYILLGLGEDGHTASIFPDQIQLFQSNRFFEVATHPQSGQKRISVTGSVINQARMVSFIVTGEAKAEMVARILEKKPGWEHLPASLVHPENGLLYWLLDKNAAQNLKNTD
jgi:6-phosphogluconolactonase